MGNSAAILTPGLGLEKRGSRWGSRHFDRVPNQPALEDLDLQHIKSTAVAIAYLNSIFLKVTSFWTLACRLMQLKMTENYLQTRQPGPKSFAKLNTWSPGSAFLGKFSQKIIPLEICPEYPITLKSIMKKEWAAKTAVFAWNQSYCTYRVKLSKSRAPKSPKFKAKKCLCPT